MIENRGFSIWELLIVVVIITILALIAVPNMMESSRPSVTGRVRVDLRVLSTAVEAYYADHNAYPPMIAMERAGLRAGDLDKTNARGVTTLDLRYPLPDGFRAAGYLDRDYHDPFTPGWRLPYGYYTVDQGFIFFSVGREGVYRHGNFAELYDPKEEQIAPALVAISYDPTNGTASPGALFRVKY